jgi:hypothetical protein
MVPVGDQRGSRLQVGGDRRQLRGIVDRPEPVPYPVPGHGVHQRLSSDGRLLDDAGRRAALASVIQQKDRLQVGLGGLHQLKPARHRSRRDVLVRPDDAGLEREEAQRADQAPLGDPRAR